MEIKTSTMKYLLSMLLSISAIYLSAQNCTSGYRLFTFPLNKKPIVISQLGSSPQFDFLRGITDPNKFFEAIQKNRNVPRFKKDFAELNKLMKEIGFTDGIEDERFSINSLHYEYIPYNTKGNLGSNSENYKYVILKPDDPNGLPGWKLTSPTGCYIFIFTKCGNAFYPQGEIQVPPNSKICPEVPCPIITVDIIGDSEKIECEVQKTKRIIKTEFYITGYIKKKITIYKQKNQSRQGKGQQQSQETKLKTKKQKVLDSLLVYADEVEVEECQAPSADYTVAVASQTIAQKVCKDSTIHIPLKLSLKGASSITYTPTNNQSIRKIVIRQLTKKKTFKLLRREFTGIISPFRQ